MSLPDRYDCIDAIRGKYIIDPETRCWNSILKPQTHGYISIWIKNKHYYLHRIVFFIYNGYLNKELDILHKCDNKKCCNPDHLFEGTHQDNMLDCINKGRGNRPKGSNHWMSKLTEQQVLEIRHYLKTTNLSQREIGEKYNVSKDTISLINSGKIWTHI